MDTQNYKRTLAGSVGAGMGALMGASGRTYFILEHKTSSKYHQAGESQKIIVDQVELGKTLPAKYALMKVSKQLAANMLQLYATVKTGNLSTFHTPIRHWSTDIL